MEDLTYEQKLELGVKIFETKENSPRILGELVSKMTPTEIKKYADDLEKATGRKISFNSLRVYKRIWEDIWSNPDTPADLTVSCALRMESTGEAKKWLRGMIEQGLSSAQVTHMIKSLKPKKVKTCPHCGKDL